MLMFEELENLINLYKCKTCRGLGEQNDAEPGDISSNTWTCPKCEGSGINVGQERAKEILAFLTGSQK
jgi:DnaJ-class molecular chaperone